MIRAPFTLLNSFRLSTGTAMAALLLLASSAWGANPTLTNMVPAGGQRGTEVDVVISGARLGDVEELVLYYPGVSVKQLEATNDANVKATLAIAPDCRLGNHALRVRTATGITYNLLLFSVGALPEVAEKEPNNDFDNAQRIELDTTVNGVVTNEDVDCFVVRASKGETVTAEVEGIRLGRSSLDPFLAVYDASHREIQRCDDEALLWQDAVVSFTAPADGDYYVQVRDTTFRGSALGNYRLHVGRFPRPRAIYPAGGKPGETLEVEMVTDRGSHREKITLPTAIEPYPYVFFVDRYNVPLFAQNKLGIAPTPNLVRLSSLESVLEVEPNNDRETATPAHAPAALNGIISAPGDVDYFKFDAKKDQQFDIRVHARSLRSPLDSVLNIYNSRGSRVANNDDVGQNMPDSYLRFRAPADDTYYLQVSDLLSDGGPDFVYRVDIEPLSPKLRLTVAEKVRYLDTVVNIPRGARGAVIINAQRQNFGGDLELAFGDLPPGVKVETIPMAANKSFVPVVFYADPEADKAAGLATVDGRPADAKIQPDSTFQQSTLLVRGQNNREVWSHTTNKLALAVTERLPFSIEPAVPHVPLVRNGSMQLKVVAHRDEGFTAPITLRLLYNPSGVSSSANVVIPEGKNEAEIPITANSTAELGKFKIVVLATATVGNGPVEVAAEPFDLQIGEPYFDLAFKPAAVAQNGTSSLAVTLDNNVEFEGEAKVELVGLPAAATAEPVTITKDSTDAVFVVAATDKTPLGRHRGVMARLTVTLNGEPILHTFGPGELRVDRPIESKGTVAGNTSAGPAKPVSRLEQLRQEAAAEPAAAQQNNQK